MSLVESLFTWFSSNEPKSGAPEDVCVNCWGHQEYDGVIREMAADKQIDINNGRARRAFITEFAVKHVDGIRLKRTPEGKRCDACGNTHRLVD